MPALKSQSISSLVRNSRFPYLAGRTMGVKLRFVQIPCKSGWPSEVYDNFQGFLTAVLVAVCALPAVFAPGVVWAATSAGAARAVAMLVAVGPTAAQTAAPGKVTPSKTATPGEWPAYKAPLTTDGKPNLNGIWQAFVTADIDVLDHDAQPGPHPEVMGAYGAWPGGQGIVEGGEIPYKPGALAMKKANADNRMVIHITPDEERHATGDPELKCYRPGIPRANYMPFPLQILQRAKKITVVSEFAHALRTIYMQD